MAIHGFLETTRSDRAVRRTLYLEARGATGAGESTDVVILNISQDGLLLESPAALGPGESIALDLPEVGPVGASVVWTSGDLFGCRFDSPLSPAALAAAELRSLLSPGPNNPVRTDAPDDLSARLQRLRKERGLTLAQVAERLGVSKPTVWPGNAAAPVRSRGGSMRWPRRSELAATN